MAVSAIFMLVIGVYAVSTSQGNVEKESRWAGDLNESTEEIHKESDEGKAEEDERAIDEHMKVVETKRNKFFDESKNVEKGQVRADVGKADSYIVQINPLRGSEEDTQHNKKLSSIVDSSIDNGFSVGNDNTELKRNDEKYMRKRKTSCQYLNESSGAYFLCICVGFCDGALLVPFKLSSNGITDSDGILEVFRYLASFGISSILVSPILFFFYCLFINQRRVPCFYFRSAFLPGVSSGVLWAAANFLSVHATYYLGNLRTCLSSGKYSRIRLNV